MAFNSCDDCFFFFLRVISFFLTSFYLNRAYFSVSWFLFSRLAHSIFFFSTTSSIFLLFRCMCVCRLRSLQADSHRYAVFRISRSGAFLCSDGGEDGAFFFSPSFPLSPWQLLIVCVLVLRTATRSCEADSPSKIVAMDGFTKRKKKNGTRRTKGIIAVWVISVIGAPRCGSFRASFAFFFFLPPQRWVIPLFTLLSLVRLESLLG